MTFEPYHAHESSVHACLRVKQFGTNVSPKPRVSVIFFEKTHFSTQSIKSRDEKENTKEEKLNVPNELSNIFPSQ